jgi:C4-dicarboxylate-specific signal transduction histidine kinase
VRNTIKGSPNRQPIDLNEVVTNVVHMVRPDAAAHSCEVETSLASGLPLVEADPTQMQQLLINLVNNAFDAMLEMPSDRRKVHILTQSNDGDTVRVTVRDQGMGVPKEAEERLFEHFFTTKKDGLGMGLAIARSIVESHGGNIDTKNDETGGARFSFTLPIKRA